LSEKTHLPVSESPANMPHSVSNAPPRRRWVSRSARVNLLIVFAIETATILISAVLAFLLRFDFRVPAPYFPTLLLASGIWVPVKLTAFKLLGLDRRWARYISLSDLLRLTLSNLIGSCLALLVLLVINSGVPKSVYAIDFLLCVMLTAGLRVAVRVASEANHPRKPASHRKRTIVYGAGNAGASLLRDLRQDRALNYDVCGFVDDNPEKAGLVLQGLRVLGRGSDLEAVARKYQAEFVLIAIPSITGSQMKVILERCTAAGIPYKTIPGLAELIDENGLARQIRDVAVEDLLGRTPVNLDHDRISAKLRAQTILVTGAAGSIGSEICRQVARFRPAAIIGFEIAESPLFHLGREIARDFPGTVFHPEIGSVQNSARLREVFERHRPSMVYHAAAYKHVPMMESHIFEAIENNVFGTMNVVEAARTCGVAEFVMISSDKAVRPTSVMGATKRLAELLVRSFQPDGSAYVSVRFGNVLGSNGSVVPIFKEQIARGGPVTVTHPDMRRYFMTIPEACQLVLQASTMGKGSEIFVLNMGEPVRIADLARNLILLSGLRPEHDIRITFTGPRPGEKLFEELNEEAEGLLPTHHEKINVFAGASMPWPEIERHLGRLRTACRERNGDELLSVVRQVVPEYRPSAELMGGLQAGGVARAVAADMA
jgi:FlaA1/EpsC-like NDP-sugar epimerase